MEHRQLQSCRMNKKRKPQKHKLFVNMVIVILWGLFLSLNTWTESIEKLMYLHTFGFKWISNPDFLSFFYFNDITLIHPEFIKVKLGHFIGFAIMDVLIFNLLRSHKYSIGISIIFAFLTELLQLFFGRDGRFYDLIIDSLGVLSVFFILKRLKI
ncbi:VanZ family protein [Neobacillus sp. NPDC097160]|uniref:VanZ family protein n=1 Tax=Neobacillus sp. NPDC097160 TaxID=3364298 RepID=UPI003802401A